MVVGVTCLLLKISADLINCVSKIVCCFTSWITCLLLKISADLISYVLGIMCAGCDQLACCCV